MATTAPVAEKQTLINHHPVGRIKGAVYSGIEMPFGEGLALERELQQHLLQSEDAHEGLTAYVDKRTPQFKAK
jgi:enoyl-CoA hydratase/carnithine racemase